MTNGIFFSPFYFTLCTFPNNLTRVGQTKGINRPSKEWQRPLKRDKTFFFFSFFPLWISTSHTSRLISIAIKRITSLSFSLSSHLSLSPTWNFIIEGKREKKKVDVCPPDHYLSEYSEREREREKNSLWPLLHSEKLFGFFTGQQERKEKDKTG